MEAVSGAHAVKTLNPLATCASIQGDNLLPSAFERSAALVHAAFVHTVRAGIAWLLQLEAVVAAGASQLATQL